MMRRATVVLGLIIFLIGSPRLLTLEVNCQPPAQRPAKDNEYLKEILKWRGQRRLEVNGANGWTTLVGLFWLNEGRNKFGSDPSNDIVLPRRRSPGLAGVVTLDKEVVHLEASPDAGITSGDVPPGKMVLQSDAVGLPTVFKMGSLTFFVIKRGEKFGLRVKDKQHPARTRFAGLTYFPVNVRWRLEAKFETYDPPKIVPIVNVLGMVDNMTSPGALVFGINGITYRLDAVLEKGSKQLFIIFADKTTGKQTYGAGRYLYADPAGPDGKVIVDFNRAYNPPCAFTKFATCPLPPPQNRLAIRVDAGEMKYAGSGH